MSQEIKPTARTRLKRKPKRGAFERHVVYGILDEAFICHVGFVVDDQPFVIPTGYARGRPSVASWFSGEPDDARNGLGDRRVRDRNASGWSRSCTLGDAPFDELPLGGDLQ
jgi:hypothetical protein